MMGKLIKIFPLIISLVSGTGNIFGSVRVSVRVSVRLSVRLLEAN